MMDTVPVGAVVSGIGVLAHAPLMHCGAVRHGAVGQVAAVVHVVQPAIEVLVQRCPTQAAWKHGGAAGHVAAVKQKPGMAVSTQKPWGPQAMVKPTRGRAQSATARQQPGEGTQWLVTQPGKAPLAMSQAERVQSLGTMQQVGSGKVGGNWHWLVAVHTASAGFWHALATQSSTVLQHPLAAAAGLMTQWFASALRGSVTHVDAHGRALHSACVSQQPGVKS